MSTLEAPVASILLRSTPPKNFVLGKNLPFANPGTASIGFAFTCLLPITIPEDGIVTGWKSEFEPAFISTSNPPAVIGPAPMQLKVLRPNPSSINDLQVVKEGRIQDPRPSLAARFGPPPQAFDCIDSVTTFTEHHLTAKKNDVIGMAFLPDPNQDTFYYPYDQSSYVANGAKGDVAVGQQIQIDIGVGMPLLEVLFTTALRVSLFIGQKVIFPLHDPSLVTIVIPSNVQVRATDIDVQSIHIGNLRPAHTKVLQPHGFDPQLECLFDVSKLETPWRQPPFSQKHPLQIALEGITVYGEPIYGELSLPVKVV